MHPTFVKYLPYTTRKQRPSEKDEYRFVQEREMIAIQKNETILFSNYSYGNHFLTTWPEQVPKNTYYTYIYLPEAATKLKKYFKNHKIVQILPANNDVLKRRITDRDPNISGAELALRLEAANREIMLGAKVADAVITNDSTVATGAERLYQTIKPWLIQKG